jgi:hypothetical protein
MKKWKDSPPCVPELSDCLPIEGRKRKEEKKIVSIENV